MKKINDVRKLAEEQATHLSDNISEMSADDLKQMFRTFQVHQIELEMQNDEIRKNQMELGISNKRYFDLYEMAPVGYLTVNEKQMIIESNLTAADLLGLSVPGGFPSGLNPKEDSPSMTAASNPLFNILYLSGFPMVNVINKF